MNRVIFLDIDGVLNSDYFLSNVDHSNEIDWREFWINNIDLKSISFLNEIIEHTNASVVISSTWRIMMTLDELRSVLKIVGFNGNVIGCTPYIQGENRCVEIGVWLEENKPQQFIVIDDVVSDFNSAILDRTVKTDCGSGLVQLDVWKAIELFR